MTEDSTATDCFERLFAELRPRLHGYCARMTGSVIDGEDVVQETLLKAFEAFPRTGPLDSPEGWLFRIAHNAALDFLRRRGRREVSHSHEELETMTTPVNPLQDRDIAAASLRTFMRLPVAQRSSVILRDVLGHSLDETCTVMGESAAAVKSALQRGRVRLRELAQEPDDTPLPVLAEADRTRLLNYIELFNTRDFDSIRDMLAEDVRLDVVNRAQRKGRRDVGEYFTRYEAVSDWHLAAGFVDRRPAILVFDPNDLTGPPWYFIIVDWSQGNIAVIRDFRFARYALEGAELLKLA